MARLIHAVRERHVAQDFGCHGLRLDDAEKILLPQSILLYEGTQRIQSGAGRERGMCVVVDL